MDNRLKVEGDDIQILMADCIDLEKIEDINQIFSKLNYLKAQLADLSVLQDQYAAAVNELYEININDSQRGEQISQKALELGISIKAAQEISKEIKELESELTEKYGLLYETIHAA